jgi:hypothetical protein
MISIGLHIDEAMALVKFAKFLTKHGGELSCQCTHTVAKNVRKKPNATFLAMRKKRNKSVRNVERS